MAQQLKVIPVLPGEPKFGPHPMSGSSQPFVTSSRPSDALF